MGCGPVTSKSAPIGFGRTQVVEASSMGVVPLRGYVYPDVPLPSSHASSKTSRSRSLRAGG